MRRLLNKLLVKFGLLLTKAPKSLFDKSLETSDALPAEPEFLAGVNGEFGPLDIILDDGSHKTHHQNISFGALFRSALKDGGCYMVEDGHTNYWLKHVDSPRACVKVPGCKPC